MTTEQNPKPTADLNSYTLFTLAFCLFIFFAVQTEQVFSDKANLQRIHSNQEPSLAELNTLQQRLDGLASGTQQLADAGNRNAQQLVEEFRARGVAFNNRQANAEAPAQPSAAPSNAPAAAKQPAADVTEGE